MKPTSILSLAIAILFSSCVKENADSPFPMIFTFHHSAITIEKAYVKGNNDNFSEIDSKAGSLKELRTFANTDIYQYVRNNRYGMYVESFEIPSKDSVRMNVWNSGTLQVNTVKGDIDNVNGEIIDPNLFGLTIKLDKNKGEIQFCMAFTLTIANRTAPLVSSYGLAPCNTLGIQDELKGIIDANSFEKNDTLGLYLMDMIYKQ